MAKKAEFNIETVKKYIFWAFFPIALLLPLITTILAVGSISEAFEARKKSLNNTKSAVEQLKTDAAHPNQQTIDEINVLIRDLRGRVRQAWRTLEKDQRERNLWPSEVGALFMEEIVTKKWGEEISVNGREYYLNFINRYLPSLEIYVERHRIQKRERLSPTDPWGEWQELKLEPVTSAGSGGGMSTGMGEGASGFGNMDATGSLEPPLPQTEYEEQRYVGKVHWPNPETRTVTSSWARVPTYTEIWYAQEELWVYKALLWVIKDCNKDATGPHNATVKRIENLLIGQMAASALEAQTLMRFGQSATGAGMESPGGASSDSSAGGGAMGMEFGAGGSMIARTEEEAEMIKKTRRYVDETGKPLLATEESQFQQFKRMPICLRLIVDQRKIPEILVSCANSSMPIDVLWVRINPGAAKPFDLAALDPTAAAAGGAEDGGMGSGGAMGAPVTDSGPSGAGAGGGMGGGAGSNEVDIKLDGIGGPYGTNAVPIEIYGCINIFNSMDGSTQLAEDPAAVVEETDASVETTDPETTNSAE